MSLEKNLNPKNLNLKNFSGGSNKLNDCITGNQSKEKILNTFKKMFDLRSSNSINLLAIFLITTIVLGIVYEKILNIPQLFLLFSIALIYKSNEPKEDKIVTFIILVISNLIVYFSWWNLENVLGIPTDNPIFIGYFVILFFFISLIIISRFSHLNLVKIMGWVFGLLTIGLFIFTNGVLGSLKECEVKEKASKMFSGENPYIVIPIYLAWIIMFILLFIVETICKTNSFWDIFTFNFGGKLFWTTVVIATILLWYTWKRCNGNESGVDSDKDGPGVSNAEQSSRDKPKWINTEIYIAMAIAGFSFLIQHNMSSIFFSFLGFSIVDQCLPKNDTKQLPFATLIFLNIIYFIINKIYVKI